MGFIIFILLLVFFGTLMNPIGGLFGFPLVSIYGVFLWLWEENQSSRAKERLSFWNIFQLSLLRGTIIGVAIWSLLYFTGVYDFFERYAA